MLPFLTPSSFEGTVCQKSELEIDRKKIVSVTLFLLSNPYLKSRRENVSMDSNHHLLGHSCRLCNSPLYIIELPTHIAVKEWASISWICFKMCSLLNFLCYLIFCLHEECAIACWSPIENKTTNRHSYLRLIGSCHFRNSQAAEVVCVHVHFDR